MGFIYSRKFGDSTVPQNFFVLSRPPQPKILVSYHMRLLFVASNNKQGKTVDQFRAPRIAEKEEEEEEGGREGIGKVVQPGKEEKSQ